ncbi:MAG TPA: S1 RNA-binding domain-containing protein, partial [Nitrosospira sp.]
ASAVHPESYPVVERILADIKQDIKTVISNDKLLKSLDPSKYADEKFGLPTVTDILSELEKPGRDPRPEFTAAAFKEGVNEIADLRPGMMMEGVVTNVTAFGAFVDIGVHQDGLVHISALADRFVKDPHTVVKAGQVVKVKVLEVDEKRKRIALTMRLTDNAPQVEKSESRTKQGSDREGASSRQQSNQKQKREPEANTAMAAAFAKLRGR